MNRQSSPALAWILAGLAAWWMLTGGKLTNPFSPAPTPAAPVSGDDMGTGAQFQAAITGPSAKADAAYFASVFEALAGYVEVDGRQPKPVLVDRIQAEQLFENAGLVASAERTRGKYPGMLPIMKTFFETRFPPDDGPITAADRAQLAQLFRALAAGCRKVS